MSDETAPESTADYFPLDEIASRGETAVRIARLIVSLDEGDSDLRDEMMRYLRAMRLSFKTYPAAAEIRGAVEGGGVG
jgi:hypothetical protein